MNGFRGLQVRPIIIQQRKERAEHGDADDPGLADLLAFIEEIEIA
jgi:hypothetical protein